MPANQCCQLGLFAVKSGLLFNAHKTAIGGKSSFFRLSIKLTANQVIIHCVKVCNINWQRKCEVCCLSHLISLSFWVCANKHATIFGRLHWGTDLKVFNAYNSSAMIRRPLLHRPPPPGTIRVICLTNLTEKTILISSNLNSLLL